MKPPTQADVLIELARVQTFLAQVSLLDNQFGIDDMHLIITAQFIEQQFAAMKAKTGVEDIKEDVRAGHEGARVGLDPDAAPACAERRARPLRVLLYNPFNLSNERDIEVSYAAPI